MFSCRSLCRIRNKAKRVAGDFFVYSLASRRCLHAISFATIAPEEISGSQPAEVHNLVQGSWKTSTYWNTIVDPLNGEPFIKVAEVPEAQIKPFVESLSKCPKYGLHNPFRAPESPVH
ncbi:putative aldehyde dehydrogenase [Platanthera zijinensis]|uniref:Aldehyde dehydrogenase n=1 Tax=Platanthera zijinensis TaxID=2320716 RepID=A0AAP0C0U7_9ASPA